MACSKPELVYGYISTIWDELLSYHVRKYVSWQLYDEQKIRGKIRGKFVGTNNNSATISRDMP